MTDPAEHTALIFDRYAAQYAARYDDVSRYAEALGAFLALLPPEAEVLELACGPGNVTRHLLHHRPDLRVLGTDLAPAMLALARERVPAATFARMDQRDLASLGRRFHGVVCAFGLPYLNPHEAAALISDAALVLHPGGALYVSTMVEPAARSAWEGPTEQERILMHHHAERDLVGFLEGAGLRVTHESGASYTDGRGMAVVDWMGVAVRGA